jgi:hypothetical protein
MRKLDRYVASTYLKYYVILLALAAISSLGSMSSAAIAYVALTPLACVATLALCCTVVELGFRREFETLQSFAVWRDLDAAAVTTCAFGCAVQAAFAGLAVAIAFR